jgi:DNA invertase Pin-like site-specific DNA recombinase
MVGAFYAIFAQMERQMISDRVKQGMIVAKQKGHLKGRRRGIKKNKLDNKKEEIIKLAKAGNSFNCMGKLLNVSAMQLRTFMIRNNLVEHYCYVGKGQHSSLKV